MDKNFVKKTNKEKLMERYKPKEEFIQRIEKLIGKEDAKKFFEIAYTASPDFIRVNTLKVSPDVLKKKLEGYGWVIGQPYPEYPEILVVERASHLVPGALGKTIEHLLGYFYVQEISSMLPIIALKPAADELFLDLCASPGSKTTQAAATMNNQGTIIANEVSLGRIRILNANLEKSGVSNVMVTRKDGVQFCKRWSKEVKMQFDKILVDAPCSGEGTLRKSPKTFEMWNLSFIKALSKVQRKLASEALKLLRVGGEMVYSTCTLGPEEDEAVVNYLKQNFDIEILKVDLPLKMREGVTEWEGEVYDKEIKNCRRLYPQDNNSDGFFLAKIRKLSDECKLEEVDHEEQFQEKFNNDVEEGLVDEAEDLEMETDKNE
ncbi:MAG: RsmB/NOP family class I SAM-dependent RNA methyltransferase [archaeon]